MPISLEKVSPITSHSKPGVSTEDLRKLAEELGGRIHSINGKEQSSSNLLSIQLSERNSKL